MDGLKLARNVIVAWQEVDREKICSVGAETWHFSCQRPCQHDLIVSARSEHFFMLAPGPTGIKGIQDGGQNGQQENMLRLS